jgi:hypothetical protein
MTRWRRERDSNPWSPSKESLSPIIARYPNQYSGSVGRQAAGGLRICGEVQELPLHRVDTGEVCRDLVITAALAGGQTKPALGKGLGRTRAAQMDYRGKLLLVLRIRLAMSPAGENRPEIAIQINRRELNGVARQHPRIESAEPAGVFYDNVIVDTKSSRLGEAASVIWYIPTPLEAGW